MKEIGEDICHKGITRRRLNPRGKGKGQSYNENKDSVIKGTSTAGTFFWFGKAGGAEGL